MKTLKLLNRQFLSIIAFTFFLGFNSYSEEQPVDIWNLDKKKTKETSSNITPIDNNENGNQATVSDIYKMQVQKETDKIKMEETLSLNKTKIVGLYDPEDYDLKIDMWANSDGDQLKNLFSNLTKLDLSNDAADLMNILLLTNAYYPNRNIIEEEFLKIKSDWLIKNQDFNIIEEYLIKNQIFDLHPKLTRHILDQYLSMSNISRACNIFSQNSQQITDEYLSKFNLYCLINQGKKKGFPDINMRQ